MPAFDWKPILVPLFVCGCISLGVMFVSANHGERFNNRQETIDIQMAALDGMPIVMDGYYFGSAYNRVLFGMGLRTLSGLGIFVETEWYLILRILTLFLALLTYCTVTRRISGADGKLLYGSVLLLGFSLLFTFNHGWESPSDFLDLFFFALLTYFSVKKHYIFAMLVALLGAMNRESVVFVAFCGFACMPLINSGG